MSENLKFGDKDINEKCRRLHLLFNEMKPHHFTKEEINNLGFDNGVYIIFEEGEAGHEMKRIVRVGTHRKLHNLKKRLNQHRRNSGSSVFRRKIGCAILNKNDPNDLDIELWYNKKYNKIEKKKLKAIRNDVTQHIIKNTTFVAFNVNGTSKDEKGTQFWESKIIATIAICSECLSSDNWLGKYIPEKYGELNKVKEFGMWLSDEIDSPILNDNEIIELEKIVKQSVERYE